MQMNWYSLDKVASKLQTAGVKEIFMEFTDHAGSLGVTIYFIR